jgi:superfamily II DNA/RNA helicase
MIQQSFAAPAQGATGFVALGVSDDIAAVLDEQGISAPFPVQTSVIPEALRGGDVLAKSPTGSGKTLAFAIPIVEHLGSHANIAARIGALVLVPTRELASQVTEAMQLVGDRRGIRVVAVYGGVPLRKQAQAAKDAHVLVATPGRLQDLVDRQLVSLDNVSVLVLDEADRMLDMGFKPQVDKIVRLLRSNRQTMFFSATLDGEVGELARRYTHFAARFDSDLPEERRSGEVDHQFIAVTLENKVQTLIDLLPGDEGLALVFVRTKAGPDRRGEAPPPTSTPSRSTATRRRAARAGSPASTPARSGRSSRPTWPHAASTSGHHARHRFDPPEEASAYTHRVGRTGRRARRHRHHARPARPASPVSRVARLQGHTDHFEESGMTMARPRLVSPSPWARVEVVEDERLTAKQAEALRTELEELEGPRRTGSSPRQEGPRVRRSLDFEYHAAKNEQGLLEARIRTLRHRLDNATIVEEATGSGRHRVGRRDRR